MKPSSPVNLVRELTEITWVFLCIEATFPLSEARRARVPFQVSACWILRFLVERACVSLNRSLSINHRQVIRLPIDPVVGVHHQRQAHPIQVLVRVLPLH